MTLLIIFIVDRGNHRIRRINAQYDVTTFAGSGVNGFKDDSAEEAAFHWPETICILNDGNILVGDTVRTVLENSLPKI